MTLTRRWFLVGSTAAIAATRLSLPGLTAPKEITPVIVNAPAWALEEISFTGNSERSFPVLMGLSRPDAKHDLFRFGINAMGGSLVWKAVLGGEIFVPPKTALRLKAEPDIGLDAAISLQYRNFATRQSAVSRYVWTAGVLSRETYWL